MVERERERDREREGRKKRFGEEMWNERRRIGDRWRERWRWSVREGMVERKKESE